MRNANVLLFCDMGHIIVGQDKLEENVYLDGGGDWDFKISTVVSEETREEFENVLMHGNNHGITNIQPQSWCEICDIIGIHFATKKYIWKKYRTGKSKVETISRNNDLDVTGFEAYLHFNELHDWRIICNDGNFCKVTCEWENEVPHTYVLFAFATS